MAKKNLDKYRSSKIERLLDELDWDCTDRFHQRASLSILHWYPASFITALPGNVIDIFSDKDDIVWDPFCGSGITAVEAFRKGRVFYGNDICRISVLVTKAKIHSVKFRGLFEKHFPKLMEKLQNMDLKLKFNYDFEEYLSLGKQAASYEDLKPWYEENTLKELLILKGFLEATTFPSPLSTIYKTVFLNIAKIACAQQKTWGHIADNVLPKEQQKANRTYAVLPNYVQRLSQILNKTKRVHTTTNLRPVTVKLADSRAYYPDKPVDLIVTSPPYPHMADYVTSQRLSYYWLGYSKKEINKRKIQEIGARYRRHSPRKNTLYLENLVTALENILISLKEGGIFAIMLPDYNNNDSRKKTIHDLFEFMSKKLILLYRINRNLDEMNRWAPFRRLKHETLLIWGKDQ
jgi:DNA modification methylase